MTTFAYKIVGIGKTPILRVEVVAETAQFCTYIDDSWGQRRQVREKKKGKIFATFEEARAAWQAEYTNKVVYYRRLLESAKDGEGRAKGLRDPYKEPA
jgi:hypothetical protein